MVEKGRCLGKKYFFLQREKVGQFAIPNTYYESDKSLAPAKRSLLLGEKLENVVIIRGLGIQVTTKYVIGLQTVFIPQEQVQKIFINEVISRNKVIYILSLLTKDEDTPRKLIPLFFGILPRLTCLQVIYKQMKAIQEETAIE